MPRGRSSLKEVAARAGVSASTASRALHRPDLVHPETRRRVLEAAQALGYVPDRLAQGLRRRSSRTLGLILSDISVHFHAEVAKGVEEAAGASGYSVILCHAKENPEAERRCLELLLSYRVAGVILEPTGKNREFTEHLVREGLRIVEVDRLSGASKVGAVLSDNRGGAALAAEHLLAQGHRRFAVIAGELGLTSCWERLEGFRETLARLGGELPEKAVLTCPSTPEGGYIAADQLLRQGLEGATALFVTTGQMALGVLRRLREEGVRIPQDLSLVSFDDTPWASIVDPPLTVVAQQAVEMGRRAALWVIRGGPSRVQRLPTQLICRASVDSPPSRPHSVRT